MRTCRNRMAGIFNLSIPNVHYPCLPIYTQNTTRSIRNFALRSADQDKRSKSLFDKAFRAMSVALIAGSATITHNEVPAESYVRATIPAVRRLVHDRLSCKVSALLMRRIPGGLGAARFPERGSHRRLLHEERHGVSWFFPMGGNDTSR
jgi:hypothetical protein